MLKGSGKGKTKAKPNNTKAVGGVGGGDAKEKRPPTATCQRQQVKYQSLPSWERQ